MKPATGGQQLSSDIDSPPQRIDRWLWHARFFKTRTLASKFVDGASIRITRNEAAIRVEKASFMVRPGDMMVFTIGERLKIIIITACSPRRGPASEAKLLYNDQSPPPAPRKQKNASPFAREKGAGRPTKKDRRALNSLKGA